MFLLIILMAFFVSTSIAEPIRPRLERKGDHIELWFDSETSIHAYYLALEFAQGELNNFPTKKLNLTIRSIDSVYEYTAEMVGKRMVMRQR